jgi:hypothetical protein
MHPEEIDDDLLTVGQQGDLVGFGGFLIDLTRRNVLTVSRRYIRCGWYAYPSDR